MKWILTLTCFTLISGVAAAQSKGPASGKGGTEQTIMRIEQEMLDALLKRDPSVFERYMADNSAFTTPDGALIDKARFIADLKSSELKMDSSAISDMKVTVHGDTAVATYVTNDKGTYKGKDISGTYRWTDVFVRQKGGWKLIAGHGSPKAQQ